MDFLKGAARNITNARTIGDDLKWISKAIEDAKKIEEVYQKGKSKSCFLWWC